MKIQILLGVFVLLLGAFVIKQAFFSAEPGGDGQYLYSNLCKDCHGDNGEGLGTLYPPVANSDYLKAADIGIACLIRKGHPGGLTVNGKLYVQPMPAFEKLSPIDITNLLNYLHQNWGNGGKLFKLQDVQRQLDACE